MSFFADRLIDWQRRHGRHDLPWQRTREPYRVWLAEIMLQQTQVATVIPYYARFLARCPTLAALAATPVEDVMALWSGLGYYARARNLHRCARLIVDTWEGRFPSDPAQLAALPGIGRSTANAIAVVCFGARLPILDGNVKRVLCRFLGIEGFPGNAAVTTRLWEAATGLLPDRQVDTYIQAQMDLGSMVCTRTRPRCAACPVADRCVARREDRVGQLPTPRPPRVLPDHHATLLVLRHGLHVAFERRPPRGVWGGLLSLPELPTDADAFDHVVRLCGAAPVAVSPGLTFVHGFTHFRLHARALLCILPATHERARTPLVWLAPDEWPAAALPAPIRKLLSATP